jgi:hypothetical protein
VICLAQHAHRIALGLAVELAEDRSDALQPLDQPRRRHRRGAVEDELERAEISFVEPRMIERHIDHGRHHEGEVDLLALEGGQKFLGLEAL